MTPQDSGHPLIRQIVVGLAGHIDHGKSALVRRLTGAATDRRPEEQRRGMTVDLGFSHFDEGGYRFALVDVPGHDRFVHNMVSGATGVHLGLLVVAADDSVMPQTREHFEILDLLGVSGGVIAITKSDLVNATRLDTVRREVAELVTNSTFSQAPLVAVSNVDGDGLDELREALLQCAHRVPPPPDDTGPFRLAVDRAFSLPGHGTIVTGTVRRGRVSIGESLQLLPHSQQIKVRQLERQGRPAEVVSAGERAAINLSGIKLAEVSRGDELVSDDSYRPSQRLLIQLRVLARCERGIADREPIRLHIATREVTARVRLAQPLAHAGEQLLAILDCDRSVVTEFGQRLILRRLSPADTIGGGRVLATRASRSERLKHLWAVGEQLAGDAVDDRLIGFVALTGPTCVGDIRWPLAIGASPSDVSNHVDKLIERGSLVRVKRDPGVILTIPQWQSTLELVRRHCERQSRRQHPERWFSRTTIVQRVAKQTPPAVAESAIDELIRRNWLSSREARIALADRQQLSKRQQQLLEQIAADIVAAEAAPPLRKELAEQHQMSIKDLEPLLGRLRDDGRIVRISDELAISPAVLSHLLQSLRELLAVQPTVSVAELRDQWQVTRKHALPYLQYFDEQGCTIRSDTVRVAGPRLNSLGPAEPPP